MRLTDALLGRFFSYINAHGWVILRGDAHFFALAMGGRAARVVMGVRDGWRPAPLEAREGRNGVCFFGVAAAASARHGVTGSIGTHGLCVLPRPQGASSRQGRE